MATTNAGSVKNPVDENLHAPPGLEIQDGIGEQEAEGSMQSAADMTAFVQNLLVQMQTRFQAMSEGIVSKIDEMGTKIDELEDSINDLKAEMGTELPAEPKAEEATPAEESI